MKKWSWLLALWMLCIGSHAQAQNNDYERQLCERYKERLKKYQREGVRGFNPLTGREERMTRDQAEVVIRDAEENVRLFCHNVGIVR